MSYRNDQYVSAPWDVGNFALRERIFGVSGDYLALRQSNIALRSDGDDEMLPARPERGKFSETSGRACGTIKAYESFGFERQNQHSSAVKRSDARHTL